MNTKTVLIPLASLAAIGAAALLTIGSPSAPECVQTKAAETPFEMPEQARPDPEARPVRNRFARPPAPPMPAPRPHALPVA
jgi:hypothetical protein